jgi:hypothetical protein
MHPEQIKANKAVELIARHFGAGGPNERKSAQQSGPAQAGSPSRGVLRTGPRGCVGRWARNHPTSHVLTIGK